VHGTANGTQARSNNVARGSGPRRWRAWVIADAVGTCQSPSQEPSVQVADQPAHHLVIRLISK
jgi:hypothetical protein